MTAVSFRPTGLLYATLMLAPPAGAQVAVEMGTAFTYQGQLHESGLPATGNFDLEFTLYDAPGEGTPPEGGNPIGDPVLFERYPIVNGLFTVELDFGSAPFLAGEARWLQIALRRRAGSGSLPPPEIWVVLAPRQRITPTPYALKTRGIDGHSLDADDQDPVDALYVDSAGNVGIGTSTPAARLDVQGPARAATLEITGGSPLTQPVEAWGANFAGQAQVPAGSFVAIAAGFSHSAALTNDGSAVVWGDNSFGQHDAPPGSYSAVSAGFGHCLAIRGDGGLAAWGRNDFGQSNVPPGAFSAVSAGGFFSLAIRTNGSLVGWGANDRGQASPPSGSFVAVAAGFRHAVGIRADGTLAAWGDNLWGQTDVPPGTFLAVSAGLHHCVAIREDGALLAWGRNVSGQTDVPSGTYRAVSCGAFHSVAIRTDGTIIAWGDDTYGQNDVPIGEFVAIAAGGGHTLGLRGSSAADLALRLATDSAAKPGSNTWTIWSDRRLKRNIQPLHGALERLLALRGVTFEWRDAQHGGGRSGPQLGLIADEVRTAFPEWVGRDAQGYQTLTTTGFEALTAEAVRELRAKNAAEIEALRVENAELRARLERLERRLVP